MTSIIAELQYAIFYVLNFLKESTQIEALLRSNRERNDVNQFKLARAEIVYKVNYINS